MNDLDIQNLQQQIDQLRSMIPMMPFEQEKGDDGGNEYICGDDSNVVFTPVSGTNQIKLDVYYV